MVADRPPWGPPPSRLSLPVAEIHVFAFRLDPAPAQLERFELLLAADERERADRFRLPHLRNRYVAGRARLRAILGSYLGREPAHLQFVAGPQGKPALADSAALRFNLSRSHTLGVLGVQADTDLGIDVERIRPFPDALAIAARMFTAEEHRALHAVPAGDVPAAFFGYWTRKEAVLKSTGRGLSAPLDGFTLAASPGAAPERIVVPGPEGADTRWLVPVPPPADGYVAAVAAAGAPGPLRCWTWTDG